MTGTTSTPNMIGGPRRPPGTALAALAVPRFLRTAWPWRSAGYLLSTAPVAAAAGLALSLPGLPWLYLLAHRDAARRPSLVAVVALVLVGAALIGALGPLVAVPLAAVERVRLRLVDDRPAVSGHRPAPPGRWLRTRYREEATWRALAYALLLVTVGPAVLLGVFLALLQVGALLFAPLAVRLAGGRIALGAVHPGTTGDALAPMLLGIALVPVTGYLLAAVAGAQAALARALLHGRSDERLRTELVEVTRSRARLVDTFAAERRRIERDLHDGAQQRLVSLTLQLGMARLDVPPESPGAGALTTAHEQAKQLLDELRELIHGIHPQVLTDSGLPTALQDLADRSPVPVIVDADLPGRLPEHVEATAYFTAAEALTNVVRHSGASRATITVRLRAPTLVVEIDDDGRGGADPARGSGLTGLADRAAAGGGRMLLSSPPGGPTLLRLELPCHPIPN